MNFILRKQMKLKKLFQMFIFHVHVEVERNINFVAME